MSANIGANNYTLAGIYDLNQNSAEICVIHYTLPVTWNVAVKAHKVGKAIDLAFVGKEHRRLEVLVVKIIKLFAQFFIVCGRKLKG